MPICTGIRTERQLICGGNMQEIILIGIACLIIVYIFILFVFRAIYFCFVIKQDPIESVKIFKPKGLLKIFAKEKKEDNNAKWG